MVRNVDFCRQIRVSRSSWRRSVWAGGRPTPRPPLCPYWSPSWPLGFGGTLPSDQDFPTRYNFQNGMFISGTSIPAG